MTDRPQPSIGEPHCDAAMPQLTALRAPVTEWMQRRRYRASDYSIEQLARVRAASGVAITVIIPSKHCAETITDVLEVTVGPLQAAGLLKTVMVVDAASQDGTAEIVRRTPGVTIVEQDSVCPELGPALGKGDAMWRALQVCDGDIVAFLDADTSDPTPHHLTGLLGPLLCDPSISMVRGCFDRPFRGPGGEVAHGGGRVTELMARPLLNLYEPMLAGFGQPLAGEFAARRDLLEQLPFPVGYGVEIATLIDALRVCGLDALAEAQLGTRQNAHQPLRALGEMAYAVLAAVERRRGPHGYAAQPAGRFLRPWAQNNDEVTYIPLDERPPLTEWLGRSAASEMAAATS